MDPLIKRVKTEEQKNALLKAAREQWDSIPDEFKHLVAASDEDFLAKVAGTIEVGSPAFTPPRAANAEERASLTGELLFSQIYGDRADAYRQREAGTGCAALDAAWAEKEREEFEKLIGAPARRQENAVQAMIRKALESVLSKRREIPSEHDRSQVGIVPRLAKAAADEDASSALSRFLSAYVAGNEQAMRSVARELVEAA